MLFSVTEWATIMQGLGTIVLAFLAVIQAYYLFLTYQVYRLTSRPTLYAWMRDKGEAPGLRLENAGNGVAWNCRVVVTAVESNAQVEFRFPILYPHGKADLPGPGQKLPLFDPLRDRRLHIEVIYADEERHRKTYHWEMETALPMEWLNVEKPDNTPAQAV